MRFAPGGSSRPSRWPAPLFQIGFKGRAKSYRENILAQVTGELVCDLIAGESTALYRELYDEGLINAVFDTEVMAGPNYLVNIFSGESRDRTPSSRG